MASGQDPPTCFGAHRLETRTRRQQRCDRLTRTVPQTRPSSPVESVSRYERSNRHTVARVHRRGSRQPSQERALVTYVGIDWSTQKHDLCFMNEAGAAVARQVSAHRPAGFAEFDRQRQRLGVVPADCFIGIETAHNWVLDYRWGMPTVKCP